MIKLKELITEERLDEAAPTQVILGTVDLIRWEVLQHYPDLAKWIKPQLRRIENAARKMKR